MYHVYSVIAAVFADCFFFSSRRRHTRLQGDWSSDVCSSDLPHPHGGGAGRNGLRQRRIPCRERLPGVAGGDRKSTRLNSSHLVISYAVFCLKKKKYRRLASFHANSLALFSLLSRMSCSTRCP